MQDAGSALLALPGFIPWRDLAFLRLGNLVFSRIH